jgi:succinate dehydrogenase / fumarate reductase, cytochrome b subunit
MLKHYFYSSIGKKQMVAITGLMMVLFLIGHLSGNMLIYKGPEAYNGYAAFLKHLGGILWFMRIGMITAVFLHFYFTISLVIQNRKARSVQYASSLHPETRSLSTKLMPISGLILLAYIISHLLDYTFAVSLTNTFLYGQDFGLYGLVVNSFMNPVRVVWYMIAMLSVGFHLTHAVQSVFQTFGFNHAVYTPVIKKMSVFLGILIAVGFAAIPIYVVFVFSSACAVG